MKRRVALAAVLLALATSVAGAPGRASALAHVAAPSARDSKISAAAGRGSSKPTTTKLAAAGITTARASVSTHDFTQASASRATSSASPLSALLVRGGALRRTPIRRSGASTEPTTGALGGIVTDASGDPLENVSVQLDSYDATIGTVVMTVTTGSSGAYAFTQVPAANYVIYFEGTNATGGSSSAGYSSQYYDGPTGSALDPIAVTAGMLTSGLNAALSALGLPAPILSGKPSAATDLGPVGFGSMYVDTADQRLFVANPTANEVTVLDFGGHIIAVVPLIFGAADIIQVGSLLYITERTSGQILALDPKTLIGLPIVSGLDEPGSLAFTGGYLWVSDDGDYSLARVSLSGVATFFAAPDSDPMILAASPADPNTLFVGGTFSPTNLTRIDVSSGAAVFTSSGAINDFSLEQLAITPDGQHIIPASGAPYDFEELSASTRQADGIVYPGQAYGDGAAVSQGGGGIVVTGFSGTVAPTLDLNQLEVPAPYEQLTASNSYIEPAGVGVDETGTVVFAAVADSPISESDVWIDTFNVLPPITLPNPIPPTMPVAVPTTVAPPATDPTKTLLNR